MKQDNVMGMCTGHKQISWATLLHVKRVHVCSRDAGTPRAPARASREAMWCATLHCPLLAYGYARLTPSSNLVCCPLGDSCLEHFVAPTLTRPARNEEVGLPPGTGHRTRGTSLTKPITQTGRFHQMFVCVGPSMQVHDTHRMLRSIILWEVVM